MFDQGNTVSEWRSENQSVEKVVEQSEQQGFFRDF